MWPKSLEALDFGLPAGREATTELRSAQGPVLGGVLPGGSGAGAEAGPPGFEVLSFEGLGGVGFLKLRL